jgi:hypothetical protein
VPEHHLHLQVVEQGLYLAKAVHLEQLVAAAGGGCAAVAPVGRAALGALPAHGQQQ